MTGREKQSAREAINILAESLEALQDAAGKDDGGTSANNDQDISSLLANEIADLKDHKKQDFVIWEMGMPSIVYIECNYKNGPSASDLVFHLLESAIRTGQNKSRFCKRFYPIDYTSTSDLNDIKSMGEAVARDHFPKDISEQDKIKFSIDCERRAHPPDLERIDVINAFAFAISQPPYKVDLNNPEKTVIVNVIKGSCGASVVRNYRAMQKYNLVECVAVASAREEEEERKKQGSGKESPVCREAIE